MLVINYIMHRIAIVIVLALFLVMDVQAQQQPSLIIFILDDAGFGNLSPYNGQVDYTPNIQSLADEGIVYERWYTLTSWCIPTRYALLTGQTPTPEMIAGDPDRAIDPDIVTLPEYLRGQGYATGHFGKWHITEDKTGQDALEAGFDVSYPWPTLPGSSLYDRVETTKKFIVPAAEWIRQADRPFFAYIAFSAPHTPHFPTFDGITGQGLVADSYYGIDWAIGEILRQVELRGELDNTMIVVLSDNGPNQPLRTDPAGQALPPPWLGPAWIDSYPDVDNPLRWQEGSGANDYGWQWRPPVNDADGNRVTPTSKGSVYEQGVRVPAIIKWPGDGTPPPIDNDLRWTADIYATMPWLIDASTLPQLDGRRLAGPGHSRLYLYNHPNQGEGIGAVVEQRWKYNYNTGALYDMDASTEEVEDVSEQNPEIIFKFIGKSIYLPTIFSSPYF